MMNSIIWSIKALLARHLVIEKATSQTKLNRLNVCNSCEFLREKERMKTCAVCGCFLELKAASLININHHKRRIEITHCPMGKWNDKWIVNEYND